jgi:hypothetical protein
LETLTFEAIEDGRTRLSVVQDFEIRDGMQSSGMDAGSTRASTSSTNCSRRDLR